MITSYGKCHVLDKNRVVLEEMREKTVQTGSREGDDLETHIHYIQHAVYCGVANGTKAALRLECLTPE